MRVTNKRGLPGAIVRAIENDPYEKGESDFSITGLLKPARAAALEKLHKEEIEEDASTRIFALLGQATHVVLERSARPELDLVEKRFFHPFGEYIVSGQIDLLEYDTETLSDFKITKAYAFSKKGGSGKKPEWIQQLNMQLELLRLNGKDAKKLQIVGILRDWDQKCLDPYNKKYYMSGYPEAEIVTAALPIWERERTQNFILERINAHASALEVLPKCSSQETWGGNRCKAYCAAAPFCSQYQGSKKTGLIGVTDEVQTKAIEPAGIW